MSTHSTPPLFPLELRNVSWQSRGREILRAVNCRFEQGQRVALVGPNGAGKTSLLRLVHGLVAPTSGSIWFAGVAQAFDPKQAFAGQAFVFAKTPWLRGSVHDNLRVALAHEGLSQVEQAARIEQALQWAGLASRRQDAANKLSSGERQRLAIARAFSRKPALLLLDEPCANLDPSATLAVEAMLANIAESGCTLLLVSHNLAQVQRMCEQVVFVDSGQVHPAQTVQDFFQQPASVAAQSFIQGELPWFDR